MHEEPEWKLSKAPVERMSAASAGGNASERGPVRRSDTSQPLQPVSEARDVVLSVGGLRTSFYTDEGPVEVVRGVSFDAHAGSTLGLVGESGCGKSVTAQSIMRLLPPAGRIVAGSIHFRGKDLARASKSELRSVRGRGISIVFQDSMTSLNPLLSVGRQIRESLETHLGLHGKSALARTIDLLEEVGVADPEERLKQYPHQLSGGLRQRVALAVALAADPELLIADEPTTALDVTVQAQILDLLKRQQQQRGMAMILITHDLGVIANIADQVCVMYAGRLVERGSIDQIFHRPAHPYTLALLRSVPRIDDGFHSRLPSISGAPPPMSTLPEGCPFQPRCPFAIEACAIEPELREVETTSQATACWVDLPQAV
jgi:oligopeptide/dipeptide ABC transporter ATP-binding protein